MSVCAEMAAATHEVRVLSTGVAYYGSTSKMIRPQPSKAKTREDSYLPHVEPVTATRIEQKPHLPLLAKNAVAVKHRFVHVVQESVVKRRLAHRAPRLSLRRRRCDVERCSAIFKRDVRNEIVVHAVDVL